MKSNYFKYLLLAPALIIMAAVTVYPLIKSFWISLHEWKLTDSLEIGPFIGLDNYLRAFSTPEFWNSIKVTLTFTFCTVVLVLLLSIAVALFLSREKRHLSYIRAILIIPFALSPALVGISWRFMLNPEYGLFDHIIGFFIPPLADTVWLGEPGFAMAALISVVIWIWLPYMSLMFISGLMAMPKELFEAAKVDGASYFQILMHIKIPILKPIILIAAILMTMFTLKQFDPIVTLTHGGPGDSTEVLNYHVYKTGFRYFDMGYASALGYILALITVLFAVAYMRKLVKGEGWK
ncbi:carbohydrate ABC transporter permease [Pseudalkalibacillus sp. A8]|uniref:carbohydrate ABC transporter permease n=1 Tax=Pseudalkalibacillus sp. A8 TaxID=3382641 RepID=UPI0038B4E16A